MKVVFKDHKTLEILWSTQNWEFELPRIGEHVFIEFYDGEVKEIGWMLEEKEIYIYLEKI